jgi:hypothetical protein
LALVKHAHKDSSPSSGPFTVSMSELLVSTMRLTKSESLLERRRTTQLTR